MRRLIAFAQVLAGIAVLGFGVFMVVSPFPQAGWDVLLGTFGMGLTLIFWPVMSRREHRHRENIKRSLSERGFGVYEGKKARTLHFQRLGMPYTVKPRYSALGTADGWSVHIAQFDPSSESVMFEVGLQVPRHAGPLVLLPALTFAERPILRMFEEPEPVLGDLAFTKRRRLHESDPRKAAAILGPALRQWLCEAPTGEEAWVIADGWLSCTWESYEIPEAPDFLDDMIRRVQQFMELSDTPLVCGAASGRE
jgi:hypothetical protein